MENNTKSSVKIYVFLFSLLLLLIFVILLMYAGFERKEKAYESSDQAMQTYIQQTIFSGKAEETSEKVVENIKELERLISTTNPSSNICVLNNMAGSKWVDVNKIILNILSLSLEVSQKSFGAYDPTIYPLISAWGFNTDSPRLPSSAEIKAALDYVDYRNLKLNLDVDRAKLLQSGSGIDLSSVMKGAACNIAIDTYAHQGVHSAIIAIGNSVGVYGIKSNGTDWRVAIRDPFINIDNAESIAVLKIKKGVISTSCSYEKCFESHGQKYHSLLNPKTGYPVETDLVSVSVWHENGVISDLLSTACFIMGRSQSQYLLDYYDAGAVFVDINKNIFVTDNIKNNLIIVNDDYKLSN